MPARSRAAPRFSLFAKYFLALFAAVVVPLLIAGGSEAWFSLRDQRARLDDLLRAEARAAAARIEEVRGGIRDQLGWMGQLPWGEAADDRRRLDALRLLRQVPAIATLTLIDGEGRERLFVSRIGLNRSESRQDLSSHPAFAGARADGVWFGPVTFQEGSEPYMVVAVAGNRAALGVAVAEVTLKLIWDVITAIRVGESGEAYVLDGPGRLVAHRDISLVLRADDAAIRPLAELRAAILARPGGAAQGRDLRGNVVIGALAPIAPVDWSVVVMQPAAEAFAPITRAVWRTGLSLAGGAAFAALLAWWLARRMAGPIRLLEDGVRRIGAGQFDHRIRLETGDELERLATRFNAMAGELAVSQERAERIGRLRRFLAPQVAELVDHAGDESVLDGRRVEVVVVFCDLRGFTAFSARAEPEIVMAVLDELYEAIGRVVTDHAATLLSFSGDGAMVLVNAPVPCPDPALRAVRLAQDLQARVQKLLVGWRAEGHRLGFGVGLAMGQATVGRIGSEGRLDYAAIGTVTNLASRLCAIAQDREILIDKAAADAVGAAVPLVALSSRMLKGFDEPVPVFGVAADRAA